MWIVRTICISISIPASAPTFERVLETARVVHDALDTLKMPSVVKTTGSKGLHVYVPIVRGPEQKQVWTFAKALAQELARRHPALITAEYRVAKRPRGRVLVDYNQNRVGQHAGVDLFRAAAARGDRLDAGDLEGDRSRRPHRGLHGEECSGARRAGRRSVEAAARRARPLQPRPVRGLIDPATRAAHQRDRLQCRVDESRPAIRVRRRARLTRPSRRAFGAAGPTLPMNTIAERYVKLVLAVGQHDRRLRGRVLRSTRMEGRGGAPEDAARARSRTDAERLIAQIPALTAADRRDELIVLRRDYLRRQLEALRARVAHARGREADLRRGIAGALRRVAPAHPESYFAAALEEIDRRFRASSQGTLVDRYDAFRRQFVIPPDRLDARVRSRDRRVPAPDAPARPAARDRELHGRVRQEQAVERLQLVSGQLSQPDSGQHRPADLHRSRRRSRLPRGISRAITSTTRCSSSVSFAIAAGWSSRSTPLFSPQSLIAEGTANYGIEVAFPGDERTAFERDVLYPEAGLDPSQAVVYAQVQTLVDRLAYAGNEAARKYLNGELDRAGTRRVADPIRDASSATRGAADAFLRHVSQLRDQLQPRQGSREAVRRIARRRRDAAGPPLGGIRAAAGVPAPAVGSRRADRTARTRCPRLRHSRAPSSTARSARSTSICSISCCAAASIGGVECSTPAAETAGIWSTCCSAASRVSASIAIPPRSSA